MCDVISRFWIAGLRAREKEKRAKIIRSIQSYFSITLKRQQQNKSKQGVTEEKPNLADVIFRRKISNSVDDS